MRPMMHYAVVLLTGIIGFAACGDVAHAGVWKMYQTGEVARHAPVIVVGEIVKIDVAATTWRDRVAGSAGRLRFADRARIRVDRVLKNVLTDVEVSSGAVFGALMHSIDETVPGTARDDGRRAKYRTSTDIRYPKGTKAVWLLFLDKDGRFYINRHPQQRQPLKDADNFASDIRRQRESTRAEWIDGDRSNMHRRVEPDAKKIAQPSP